MKDRKPATHQVLQCTPKYIYDVVRYIYCTWGYFLLSSSVLIVVVLIILEYAVFTTQFFAKGTVLLEYKGDRISLEEADLRTKDYRCRGLGVYIYYFFDQGKKMRYVILYFCVFFIFYFFLHTFCVCILPKEEKQILNIRNNSGDN